MQGALMKYGDLNAKVSVMRRYLFKKKDYDELLGKNSVAEIVEYLKQSRSYGDVLGSIAGSSVHRGQLEGMLKASLSRDCEKLARFSKENIHKFLDIYVVNAEVSFLKGLISAICRNEIFVPDSHEQAFDNFSFDKSKIVTAAGFPEMLEYLKGTAYYDVLNPVLSSESDELIFKTDMALDVLYYKTAWDYTSRFLDKENSAAVKKTLGTEIDILNLLWIIRAKRHYNIPADIIYTHIIPINYRLKKDEIVQLAQAPSDEALNDAFMKTKYKNIVNYSDLDIEHFYNDSVLKNMRRAILNNRFSIMPALGYLHFKIIEIGNIIRIVEGVRYNIDRNELRKYLVWEAGEAYVN